MTTDILVHRFTPESLFDNYNIDGFSEQEKQLWNTYLTAIAAVLTYANTDLTNRVIGDINNVIMQVKSGTISTRYALFQIQPTLLISEVEYNNIVVSTKNTLYNISNNIN